MFLLDIHICYTVFVIELLQVSPSKEITHLICTNEYQVMQPLCHNRTSWTKAILDDTEF